VVSVIRTWAIVGLLSLCLALTWNGQRQAARAKAAEAALATAAARVEQVEAANAIHLEHIAIMARQQAHYQALADDIDRMEGGDAPLSDYLRAVDQRLQ
jgi:Tfp pilus assembly protein PilE